MTLEERIFQRALRKICEIKGLDPSMGIIWRSSGPPRAIVGHGTLIYGWTLICGLGHTHFYCISSDREEAAYLVLLDLMKRPSNAP